MKIDALMSRDVKTVRVGASLEAAAKEMSVHDCGCLPVLDAGDHVVGMITDRDICMAAYEQARTLAEISVERAMGHPVATCGVGDSLDTAERIMRDRGVRRLPVLGFDERLVGILSLSDVVREAERRKSQKLRDLSPGSIERTLAAVTHYREHELRGEF